MRSYSRVVSFSLFISLLGCISIPINAASYGKFIGDVETRWVNDDKGRKMQLLKPFTFVDPYNVNWVAPEGSIVDGASIPQIAWSIIGGPFEGKYRNASVIHDVACEQRSRKWESVHEAFYNAMMASRVNILKAKIMYMAVYHFGPRWPMKYTCNITLGENMENASRKELKLDQASRIAVIDIQKDEKRPKEAKVIVLVYPPEKQLREGDFDKLKSIIEERENSKQGSMSLKEIQDYRF